MNKLKQLWQAETPLFARVLQGIAVFIAGIPTYYNLLSPDFQAVVPRSILLSVVIGGFAVTALLNLFKKKTV